VVKKVKDMKTNIFIILLFSLSLFSCDPYIFRIAIDDDGFETSLNFECGKIDVSGKIIADRQIFVILRLKLISPILIDPDKIEVMFDKRVVNSNFFLNDNPLKEIKSINNDDRICITINQKVQNGDTLKINIDHFIACKEKSLKIGDINLVIVPRK
jgi:hypothetical protein